MVVGFIDWQEDAYNSAAIIKDGKVLDIYRKMSLPSHGVFDERRYFRAGKDIILLKMGEVKIGITIGEDIWNPAEPLASSAWAAASIWWRISLLLLIILVNP